MSSRLHKSRLVSCALYIVTIAALAQLTPRVANAQTAQFEKPAVRSIAELLPPHLLKGPYHKVSEETTNSGYLHTYRIESNFGVMVVQGRQLLETRVGEMNALAELDKLSSSSVFADAAYKAGKGIVLAPVRVVEKTAKTLSDPEKLGDTLAAVPEGAERLASWIYRKGKSAVTAIGDAISSDSNEPQTTPAPKESSGSTTSSTIDQGTKFGLKYLGYTKREREWFRKLHVNPYTSNEQLKNEIIRVAGIETAVGTAFRFVPGLGLLGELATFNSWYERAEKLALYEDPDAIGKKNQQELLNLKVPEEIIKQFQSNASYTPWSRRFILASLTSIGADVPGHAEFIKAAATARNEPATLFYVHAAESLEKLHSTKPIWKIVASTFLPAAITRDGQLFVPLVVDYLFWTQEVSEIFEEFVSRTQRESGISNRRMAIFGRASPKARLQLQRVGYAVTEALQ